MKSYLLDRILKKYIGDNSHQRILFVLPSKRSIVYTKNTVKKILEEQGRVAIFPECVTINEFVEQITGLITIPKLDALYYLYLSYKNVMQIEIDPYYKFVKWASMLLNDFNDLLMYHPDDEELQEKIFTNLKNIKEIEHWSLNREPLTENQQRYLNLMNHFYAIFKDFNHRLLKDRFVYSGLNYQEAVRKIKSKEIEDGKSLASIDKIIFVGLNALTPAEKVIINYFKDTGKAKFYWDYDRYYTDNDKQEAGFFLRENFKEFGLEQDNQQEKSFFDEEKNIEIVTATNDVEEAMYVQRCLKHLLEKNNTLDDTAIILNKPQNLNLILSAIPKGVEYNVSMEYPLYYTSAYQLLLEFLRVFLDFEKHQDKKGLIYYKRFNAILNNPFFKQYLWKMYQIIEDKINSILEDVINKNKIYISLEKDTIFSENDEDKAKLKEVFLKLFKINDDKTNFVKNTLDFYDDYLNFSVEENDDIITINIVQTIVEQLNRVYYTLINDKENVFETANDIFVITQQILSRESVAFKGEPMKGLQIIGVLESRLLDFENIIIPYMNEGVFPPNHQKMSFFPYYDLRQYFKLPTHHNDDAVFAYLVYRLLHAPKNIFISYNNSDDTDNKLLRENIGELSRYIQQIKYELKEEKPNIKVSEKILNIQSEKSNIREITIEKNEELINELKLKEFSPTSLITFLDCSLKFYFQHILNLKEESDATETVEENILGNIFHKFMSELYSTKDILNDNNFVIPEKLEKYTTNDEYIISVIKSEIEQLNLEHKGEILIQEEVLKEDIKNFLKKELKFMQENKVKIVYVENAQNKSNAVSLKTKKGDIKIKGIPDRIDYVVNKNTYRIVDYKSSFKSSDNMEFNVLTNFISGEKLIEKQSEIFKIKKQLQLIIYIYYAYKNNLIPDNFQHITGLILPLIDRTKSNDFGKHILADKNGTVKYFTEQEIESKIENSLANVFDEIILNTDYPFQQTKQSSKYRNVCQYCAFNYICKR